MKIVFSLLSLFSILSQRCLAQSDFEKKLHFAVELSDSNQQNQAYIKLNELKTKNKDQNLDVFLNYYMAANLEDENKSMDLYKKILVTPYDYEDLNFQNEDLSYSSKNIKFNSCSSISYIFKKRNQLDSAYYYYTLSDTLYPYYSFCEGPWNSLMIEGHHEYAQLFLTEKDTIKAFEAILFPIKYHSSSNSNNPDYFKLLSDILKVRKNLILELDKAIENYTIRKTSNEETDINYYAYDFLNTEFIIKVIFDENTNLTRDELIAIAKSSKFYTCIQNLDHL